MLRQSLFVHAPESHGFSLVGAWGFLGRGYSAPRAKPLGLERNLKVPRALPEGLYMLTVDVYNKTRYTRWKRKFFVSCIREAVRALRLSERRIECSVILVSPAMSRSLNYTYRGVRKPTNVLSFPLDAKELRQYGILALGDIFICPFLAGKEAKAFEMSLHAYMAWLAVHGVLHLAGLDHERSREAARRMGALEKRILSKLGFGILPIIQQ